MQIVDSGRLDSFVFFADNLFLRDQIRMSGFCHLSYNQSLIVLALIFSGVSLGGCTTQQSKLMVSRQSASLKVAGVEKTGNIEIIPIPERLPCQRVCRDEIIALKQKLAEKDELIRNLNAREQDQAQVLQETASEISRTKNKLHRLATQPEAASKIAEVEIAINAARQVVLSESDAAFQLLGQRLLEAAMVTYRQKDYSSAMNHAAQSGELIDAITNPARKMLESQDATLVFRISIPLLATRTTSLRADPNDHSRVISILKKDTPLIATAYNGNWLRVQIRDNLSGWIHGQSVDVRIDDQNFQK